MVAVQDAMVSWKSSMPMTFPCLSFALNAKIVMTLRPMLLATVVSNTTSHSWSTVNSVRRSNDGSELFVIGTSDCHRVSGLGPGRGTCRRFVALDGELRLSASNPWRRKDWTYLASIGCNVYLQRCTCESSCGSKTSIATRCMMIQIESIVLAWCDEQRTALFIEQTLAGEFDSIHMCLRVRPALESPQQHGRCQHCA